MKSERIVGTVLDLQPAACGPAAGLRLPQARGVDLDGGLHHRVVVAGDVDLGVVGADSWRRVIIRVATSGELRKALPPSNLVAVCVAEPNGTSMVEQLASLGRACPGAVLHVVDRSTAPAAPPRGDSVPAPAVASLVSAAYHRRLAESARLEVALRPFGLAQREAVLVALYWFGVPRRDLAGTMNVAESTVATLVRRILAKTDADSLAHLAQLMRAAQF